MRQLAALQARRSERGIRCEGNRCCTRYRRSMSASRCGISLHSAPSSRRLLGTCQWQLSDFGCQIFRLRHDNSPRDAGHRTKNTWKGARTISDTVARADAKKNEERLCSMWPLPETVAVYFMGDQPFRCLRTLYG
jgi:hypothetical protein